MKSLFESMVPYNLMFEDYFMQMLTATSPWSNGPSALANFGILFPKFWPVSNE